MHQKRESVSMDGLLSTVRAYFLELCPIWTQDLNSSSRWTTGFWFASPTKALFHILLSLVRLSSGRNPGGSTLFPWQADGGHCFLGIQQKLWSLSLICVSIQYFLWTLEAVLVTPGLFFFFLLCQLWDLMWTDVCEFTTRVPTICRNISRMMKRNGRVMEKGSIF